MVADSPNYGQIWDEEARKYVDFCKSPDMSFDFEGISQKNYFTGYTNSYSPGKKISLIITDIGKLKTIFIIVKDSMNKGKVYSYYVQ